MFVNMHTSASCVLYACFSLCMSESLSVWLFIYMYVYMTYTVIKCVHVHL